MLTIGSSGVNVIKAQNLLNQKTKIPTGTSPLIPDGKYGTLTSNMVRLFQAQNSLPQTGSIDNATAVKLGMFPSELVTAGLTVTSSGSSSLPVIMPMATPSSFIQQNKRNIMIVVAGLSIVLIIAMAMRNKEIEL